VCDDDDDNYDEQYTGMSTKCTKELLQSRTAKFDFQKNIENPRQQRTLVKALTNGDRQQSAN